MKTVVRGSVALVLLMVGNMTNALTFTATAPGDNTNKTLNASVTFAIKNLELVITLSNTATYDADDRADVLTGIFFTLAGDLSLTQNSAVLGSDTAIKGRPGISGPGMNVGEQWAYRNDLTGMMNGANEGIAIANLKDFGKRYRFSGPKLGSSGGVKYGVTTDFDGLGNDKSTIKHQQLIENTIVFTMSGLPTNFTIADISNVSFQYGTDLKEENISGTSDSPAIPEPNTIVLVAVGLLGCVRLGAMTKGRHSRSRTPDQSRRHPEAQRSARGTAREYFESSQVEHKKIRLINSLASERPFLHGALELK
jgi:hypothetical protein